MSQHRGGERKPVSAKGFGVDSTGDLSHIIHVRLGIEPARDGQTDELHRRLLPEHHTADLTGSETGAAADPSRLQQLRAAIDAPLLVGSGLTAANAKSFSVADGAIVGTSVKGKNGTVDPKLVAAVVRAFKS